MIKKTVYRSSGRRVRGEDDKIPPIKKKVAPDLPLDALRNTDIRVRSVVCTLLCTAERLFAPHRPERVVRTSVGATFRATRGWARAPATGSARAKYSDEWYLSPPHRVAKLVRKASTHRYLSFDPERDAPHPLQQQG